MKRSFTQTGKAIKITSDSAVLRPSVGGDFGSNYYEKSYIIVQRTCKRNKITYATLISFGINTYYTYSAMY